MANISTEAEAAGAACVWHADVANAVAHNLSMPGIEDLQTQYVRYQGHFEAQESCEGWTIAGSQAAAANVEGAARAALQPHPLMPRELQINITAAPAEFCLPVKKLRRFRPCFKVQVRVVHGGAVHLPLRVKAFVVSQTEVEHIHEWLPRELQPDNQVTINSTLEHKLMGTRTVSHLFWQGNETSVLPGGDAQPTAPGHLPGLAQGSRFPSKQDAGTQQLQALSDDASLVSDPRDPIEGNMVLNMGAGSGTMIAEYAFPTLKFSEPTGMKPVHMVFACLVADRDLLYTVYHPPCVAICRAEQRDEALSKLHLPPHVWDDITEHGGTPPHITSRQTKRRRSRKVESDDRARAKRASTGADWTMADAYREALASLPAPEPPLLEAVAPPAVVVAPEQPMQRASSIYNALSLPKANLGSGNRASIEMLAQWLTQGSLDQQTSGMLELPSA